MTNKYLSYISDEHLLHCIANLYKAYLGAKNEVSRKKFYKNKIDTIKLIFDSKFNYIEEEDLIQTEILRQIDKSINNSIGTFHEQILGGIEGYEAGILSGYDIKAKNNSLFADIKNKHNTMNSSSAESLYQKLQRYADEHKQATCYWVQILAKKSFNERWTGDINGKQYNHTRVYKISGDKFYELLTGEKDAFYQMLTILPAAIDEYLLTIEHLTSNIEHSALEDIEKEAKDSNRRLLEQITFDNYKYYLGFDKK